MASDVEGNALCDALNANCEAIARVQRATNNQKLVDLCMTLHGVAMESAQAKASVRPFALATRDEVGVKVCFYSVLQRVFCRGPGLHVSP